ncbi:probable Protein CGI121 [Cephalotrichum gorgonifer]|uniref:EKC/KEOPS complex subunit CGI121 n=1 Tax=Cephalotrichum gorgonifer TaxID=2041049 RepID=A0AAE8SVB8_9PEZI|nr:probable Protein CGI121 [Cephalotrichum gorgonifer]
MDAMESITLEHLPATHTLHLALFTNVTNAAELHSHLLARNTDFEYTFIDASVIVSRRQVLAAAYKAVSALLNDSLLTPNVHSEVIVSLNPSTNISESYRRFGISPQTTSLLVLKLTHPASPPSTTPSSIWEHASESIKGTPLPPTDENIASVTDWAKVRKYYKLNGIPWLDKLPDREKKAETEVLVLGGMALRGV